MPDGGIVPAEPLADDPRSADDSLLVAVVRACVNGAPHLTASDDKLLGSMRGGLIGLRVSAVTYQRAGEWMRRLKVGDHLAPGSIRKHTRR